ncbi:MAG: CPBP family glutamic-type intramembrane protease [Solirubrobacteraceae bacterium]
MPPAPGFTDRPAPRASWPLWAAPVAILLGFVLGSIGTIVVDLVAHAGGGSIAHPGPAASVAADIVFDLGFVCAALALAGVCGGLSAARLGYRRVALRRAIKWLVGGAVAYFVLTAIYSAALSLKGTDKLPSDLGVTHSTAALVAAAVFVCAIAPICEELFFRGFLFGVLRELPVRVAGRHLGPWIAAVLVGILFGAAHLGSAPVQYLVPLGLLGFILCLIRWRTGSLYPCMALHSANNALALGVNELNWSALGILGLVAASWLAVAVVTGPLAARGGSAVGAAGSARADG